MPLISSCKSFSKSVLTVVPTSVWRILTPEVNSKTFLKDQILEAIRTKVKSLLYKPEQYSDEEESRGDDDENDEHLALGVLFNENKNSSRTDPPPSNSAPFMPSNPPPYLQSAPPDDQEDSPICLALLPVLVLLRQS